MAIRSQSQRKLLTAVLYILIVIIIAIPGLVVALLRFIAWVFKGHADYDFGTIEEELS